MQYLWPVRWGKLKLTSRHSLLHDDELGHGFRKIFDLPGRANDRVEADEVCTQILLRLQSHELEGHAPIDLKRNMLLCFETATLFHGVIFIGIALHQM
jgi:hypothetical protein